VSVPRPAKPTPVLAQRPIRGGQLPDLGSVFVGFLNVTTSTVQKWESPASGKHPGGAAAKLLQIIEKKGIEALAV
jgi:putative transcriptional regulator